MIMWFLLTLAWMQGASPAQVQVPAQVTVACPTCKATGRAEQDCIECNWQKTRACVRCQPNAELEHFLALTSQLADRSDFTPAQADARNSLGLKLDALHMEFQSIMDLRTRVDSRSGRKYVPGRAPCPAKGMTGSELFEKSKGCKYCEDVDNFPCPECAETGRRPCGECAGPTHTARVCDDCNGAKSLAMPTLPASVCGWCGDVGGRSCGQCDAKGKVSALVAPALARRSSFARLAWASRANRVPNAKAGAPRAWTTAPVRAS